MRTYKVIVGGSRAAKKRFETRSYQLLSSARRRVKMIKDAKDMGVATIFLMTETVEPTYYEASSKKLYARKKGSKEQKL